MEKNQDGAPLFVTDVSEIFSGYWLGLGRFIHAFADLEGQMQYVLWVETGIDPLTAQALFSGVRIEQAKDFINRSREGKGLDDHVLLKRAFAQITIITRTRNDIVHYGAQFDGGGFRFTDAYRTLPTRQRSYPVSPSMFSDMIADIGTIRSILMAYTLEVGMRSPGAKIQGDPAAAIKQLQSAVDAPWRYTPAPQPQALKRRRDPDPGQ